MSDLIERLSDAAFALHVTRVLVLVHATLVTGEYLVVGREFRLGGLLHGGASRAHRKFAAAAWARAFSSPVVYGLLVARWASVAVPVLISTTPSLEATCWLAAALLTAVCNLGVRFGVDASDQVGFLVTSALAMQSVVPDDPRLRAAALWFIAAQAVVVYVAAGVAKLRVASWRDGTFIASMVRTELYGHALTARLLGDRRFALVAAWSVIVMECAFVTAGWTGACWTLGLVATAFAFHVFNAIFLGLNRFLWAFAAMYPALCYVGAHAHR